jgi:hypothetical protein
MISAFKLPCIVNNYTITFFFRGRNFSGQVHDHGIFKSVWFSDEEVLHDFGAQITFNPDGSVDNSKEVSAKDYKDFTRAVQAKLQ